MKKILPLLLAISICFSLVSISIIGAYSKTIPAPTSVKLKSKVGAIKVTYKKVANATGYKIKYSRNKNFSKSKVVKISSTYSSKTIKNLKQGKRYYVKLQTIKGNKTSKWTKAKSAVTKLSAKSTKKKIIKGYWVSFSSQSTTYKIHKFYKDGTLNIKEIYIDISNGYTTKENENEWIAYTTKDEKVVLHFSNNTVEWNYNISKDFLYHNYIETVGPQAGESGTLKMKHYITYPTENQLVSDGREYK